MAARGIKVGVQIKGMDEIQKALKQHPARAEAVLSKAVLHGAQTLASQVRDSQLTPVDTGNMVRKTNARKLSKLAAMMFVSTRYAAAVHEGIPNDVPLSKPRSIFIAGVGWRTIKVIKARAARPFVEWALRDGGQKKIDAIMAAALRAIWRKP